MSTTAPFLPETTTVSINGVHANLSSAQVTTAFGAGNVKTASKSFTIAYNSHQVQFRAGVPMVVDAKLAAALVAAGAPVS